MTNQVWLKKGYERVEIGVLRCLKTKEIVRTGDDRRQHEFRCVHATKLDGFKPGERNGEDPAA